MKELYVKIGCAMLAVCLFTFLFVFGKDRGDLRPVFSHSFKVEEKVNAILKENEAKELVANENIKNKFVYLAFQDGETFVSHFVDATTGEETDFTTYLKSGTEEAFSKKVEELLYLKYPKFIADVLNDASLPKMYQVLERELVIHYTSDSLRSLISDSLYLRVNYNDIKNYLDFPVSLDTEYEQEKGYALDKNKKAIAFTFDDGPSGALTNRLVDILEQNKAHATFFMVGNRMEYGAEVIRNVLNKGNEIGSHSYAHKNMKRQKLEDIVSGEEKTKEIYRNITGQELLYTRPPYGNVNKSIKETLDTTFITWNVDTEDWLHRDKDYIVNHILEHVSDGDIVLMHDVYETTIDAVEEVLPKLYAAGYQVVSVSELAELKGRTLEKHSLYRSLKEVE